MGSLGRGQKGLSPPMEPICRWTSVQRKQSWIFLGELRGDVTWVISSCGTHDKTWEGIHFPCHGHCLLIAFLCRIGNFICVVIFKALWERDSLNFSFQMRLLKLRSRNEFVKVTLLIVVAVIWTKDQPQESWPAFSLQYWSCVVDRLSFGSVW